VAKRWNHLEIPQLFLVISLLVTSTMESLKNYWSELMEIREARWLVTLTGLIICICVGFYVVKLFRDMALGGRADPASYITDFQKLRDEGKLDDEEYARLKQSLPKQLPDELMGDKEDR